jgi:predicted GNAT superfamily acetyltransferase
MEITDVESTDLPGVLALNEASVPHVSSVSAAEMRWFSEHAHYFRIARIDRQLAGFLIGLRPGLSYMSPNYRWFCDRHADFAYIDRVAVSESARRQQVASSLYKDFADSLNGQVRILTCEVNLRPANDASMHFHKRQGFLQVATQETDGGNKEVALMEKNL